MKKESEKKMSKEKSKWIDLVDVRNDIYDEMKIEEAKVWRLSTEHFNAIITEDSSYFSYEDNKDYQMCKMSVEHTNSQKLCFVKKFKHTNEAIDEFENFVKAQNMMNYPPKTKEQIYEFAKKRLERVSQ